MKEALENAIKFEQEGYDYYKKIAGELEHPLAKRLFESLATQELEHIKRIERLYEAIEKNEGLDDINNIRLPGIEKEIKKVFEQLDDDKKKFPLDHKEGYKLAMEMENKGYGLYKKYAEEATDPRIEAFFKGLMEEEIEHYDALVNVYRYLTDTVNWYSEVESKVWNWMNT